MISGSRNSPVVTLRPSWRDACRATSTEPTATLILLLPVPPRTLGCSHLLVPIPQNAPKLRRTETVNFYVGFWGNNRRLAIRATTVGHAPSSRLAAFSGQHQVEVGDVD